MLPSFLHKYFWDADPKTIEISSHRRYIIERLLELGDEQAIEWLRQNFSNEEIKQVVLESRRLSPKTVNYWRLMLAV